MKDEALALMTAAVSYGEIDAAMRAVPFEGTRASFNDNPIYVAKLIRHILEARSARANALEGDTP